MIASTAEILTYLGIAGSATSDQIALVEFLSPAAEVAVKDFLQYDPEYKQHVQYLPLTRPAPESFSLEDYGMTGGKFRYRGGSGAGCDSLQLKHLPVRTLDMEVREDPGAYSGQQDGSFGSSTVLNYGTDYYLDVGESVDGVELSRTGVLRRSGQWPTVPRSVKATYYGGWTTDELATGAGNGIKMAVVKTAAKEYWQHAQMKKTGGTGSITSESIGKYSYSTGQANASMGGKVMLSGEVVDILSTHRNYGIYV